MIRKTTVCLLLLALVLLSGCIQNTHGGGRVTLQAVDLNGEPGQLGEATIGLSFNCNDHKDAVSGSLEWNDQANGVQFHARLPWTPVEGVTQGNATTCDEAAAIANEISASVGVGLINTQGQPSGLAVVGVSYPGAVPDLCGTASAVQVEADLDNDGTPDYMAGGCLDRGNIVFQ